MKGFVLFLSALMFVALLGCSASIPPASQTDAQKAAHAIEHGDYQRRITTESLSVVGQGLPEGSFRVEGRHTGPQTRDRVNVIMTDGSEKEHRYYCNFVEETKSTPSCSGNGTSIDPSCVDRRICFRVEEACAIGASHS